MVSVVDFFLLDEFIYFLASSEAILIPAPYYGGFEQDLCIENEIIRVPVHLSSKVRIVHSCICQIRYH
jgi:hypothetical protein